jgi:hypothetical protein
MKKRKLLDVEFALLSHMFKAIPVSNPVPEVKSQKQYAFLPSWICQGKQGHDAYKDATK